MRFAKLAPVELLGSRKLVWLKALKISVRNCMLNRSDILMFLFKEESTFVNPGPVNVLRPRFPSQALHGVWKKDVAGLQVPGPVPHHAAEPLRLPPGLNHPFAQSPFVALWLLATSTSGRSLRV